MKVALLGTGLMGLPMAERLLESGHHVVAYNRTRAKAERLRSAGAEIALSVGLMRRAGVSVDTFMAILRDSSLYAPSFDKKLPRFLKRNFANPNFPTRHLLKDVTLFLQEADRLGLDTRSLRGLPRLLRKTMKGGGGDDDYSAHHYQDPGTSLLFIYLGPTVPGHGNV